MNPHVDNQEYYCREDGSGEDWMENLKPKHLDFKGGYLAYLIDEVKSEEIFVTLEPFS